MGASAGSLALHGAAWDYGAVAGDVAGDVAGLAVAAIPGGGTAWRKVGGVATDAEINSAGRYVSNHLARRKAQDAAIKTGQGQSASKIAGVAGGCPKVDCGH